MGKPFHFGGFHAPRYTPTPDALFDELLGRGVLTEAELRVLLYIVRHTFGWHKDRDAISLSQLTDGMVRRDGTRQDAGAGVQRAAASRAVKGLEAKGVIRATRAKSAQWGNEITIYEVCMADDPKDPSLVSLGDQGGVLDAPALVSLPNPQETAAIHSQQEVSVPVRIDPLHSERNAQSGLEAQIRRDQPGISRRALAAYVAAWQASGQPYLAWWQAQQQRSTP